MDQCPARTPGQVSALLALLPRGPRQWELLLGRELRSPVWIWQRFHSTLWQQRRDGPQWGACLV